MASEAAAAAARTQPLWQLHVLIRRQKPGAGRPPFWQAYRVQMRPDATILDVLEEIQLHHDPTLTYRHSCHHGACGTCALRINGREQLACLTRVQECGPRIRLEPLAGFPLQSDLVVDFAGFFRRLEDAGAPFHRWITAALPPGDAPADASPEGLLALPDCIECGACISACPIAATDPGYAGPAVLNAAWNAVCAPAPLQSADGISPGQAWQYADSPHGIWRCHAALDCSHVCPQGLDPARSIMALRRLALGGPRTALAPAATPVPASGLAAAGTPERASRPAEAPYPRSGRQKEEVGSSQVRGSTRVGGVAAAWRWFDVRRRPWPRWAFALNRLTGLILAFYLLVHLMVLGLLLAGAQSYDAFVQAMGHPVAKVLDLGLFAAVALHILAALRAAWTESGLWLRPAAGRTGTGPELPTELPAVRPELSRGQTAALRERTGGGIWGGNGTLWLAQALTGLILAVVLVWHLVANHPGLELLRFAQVQARMGHAAVLGAEILLLLAGVFHAANGLRSILLDLGADLPAPAGPPERAERQATRGRAIRRMPVQWPLWALAALLAAWGLWLTIQVFR
ncbi:MAG: 4Fe-4S dicluster domain-containing protein [Firmicutes bacterium]|nr:4Fe-4S dicluster domain-containing protein [Bacillota bacterium]